MTGTAMPDMDDELRRIGNELGLPEAPAFGSGLGEPAETKPESFWSIAAIALLAAYLLIDVIV